MKIAITGHTSGLGKELYDLFDNAIGMSRSNGYDIAHDIDKVINESMDCDVFINNAYCGYHQIDLLNKLFDKWKDTDKLIVNIGSCATDTIRTFQHPYSIHKLSLEHTCKQLNNIQESTCRVMCIKPSWIDTPAVSSVCVSKMCPAELAIFIKTLIDQRFNFHISEISFLPTKHQYEI